MWHRERSIYTFNSVGSLIYNSIPSFYLSSINFYKTSLRIAKLFMHFKIKRIKKRCREQRDIVVKLLTCMKLTQAQFFTFHIIFWALPQVIRVIPKCHARINPWWSSDGAYKKGKNNRCNKYMFSICVVSIFHSKSGANY